MDISPTTDNFLRILVCGTSITAGLAAGEEWIVNLQPDILAKQQAKYGIRTSAPWTAGVLSAKGLSYVRSLGAMGVVVINSGVSANQASNANTDYAKRIATYAPSVLWLEFGTNEAILGTALATFLTNMNGIITKYKADFPLGKIVLSTLAVIGEKHPFGGGSGNFNDPLVDDGINTAAATSFCGAIRYLAISGTAHGLCDQRDESANKEAIYNPSNLLGGVLFDSSGPAGAGLHPHATMASFMSAKGASIITIP